MVCTDAWVWKPLPHDLGYGPPPHAPAHGYRHKHKHGVELIFDAGLGVYIVVGYPNYYFYDDLYYHYHNGMWHASHILDGQWKVITNKKLPPGLQKKKVK